jgi:hypothetical protein
MRKRLALGLGVLAVLLWGTFVLLLLLAPSDSVNRRTIARIRLGMTEEQVEEVLGRPADSAGAMNPEELGQLTKGVAKQWLGPARTVRVGFDASGWAFRIEEGKPAADFFERLRDAIGL